MKVEVYQSEPGNYNMQDYEQTYKDFDWKNVEQAFSWSKTGKINMAYECIDRHVDEGKETKWRSIIRMSDVMSHIRSKI